MSIDITGRTVYLSGPMTGIEDYNRAEFDGADLDLLGAGADEVYDQAEPSYCPSCGARVVD